MIRKLPKMFKVCPYCEQKIEPDYKDSKSLAKFLTEKGKIVNKSRSGVCHKHQARMATEIKRARNLALLPFVTVLE